MGMGRKAETESDGFVDTPVLHVKGTSDRPLVATLKIHKGSRGAHGSRYRSSGNTHI